MADLKEKMPRTASSQAMQSLFSAYDEDAMADSDSAEEEVHVVEKAKEEPTPPTETARQDSKDIAHEFSGSEDEVDKIKMSPPSIPAVQAAPAVDSPVRVEVAKPVGQKAMPKLVSYGGEIDVNDDTDNDEDEMDIDSDVGDEEARNKPIVDYDQTFTAADTSAVASPAKEGSKEPIMMLASGEEVRLPPEPPGRCSKSVLAKIAKYHDRMVYQNADLSLTIERRKDFRNPSIYEKLIHFIGIDEKGTNYPPELYDPSIWGPDSFYDQLAKVQKEEMDKREKEKKEKTKVEFVTATKKVDQTGAEVKSRRSKWDAQPPGGSAVSKAAISAAGVASNPTIASITSAPSGTKSTVIPASGTLNKKSK